MKASAKVTTFVDTEYEVHGNVILGSVSGVGLLEAETFPVAVKIYCS
jgi:hypothetical protein